MLAFAEMRVRAAAMPVRGPDLAVQVGRADFDQHHAQFACQEARQRHFQLRIGQEEDALALQPFAAVGDGALGPLAARRDHAVEMRLIDAERVGRGAQPVRSPLGAKRQQGFEMLRAASFQRHARFR